MSAGCFQLQEQDCSDVFGLFILKRLQRLSNVGLDAFFFLSINK